MNPSVNRLRHIIRLINNACCVHDFFFEPLNSRDKYCGTCIIDSETLSFAETDFVTGHRVVINVSGVETIECCNCHRSLSYIVPFESQYCIDCGAVLHNFLISITNAEFNLVINSPRSTIVFHDQTRMNESIFHP